MKNFYCLYNSVKTDSDGVQGRISFLSKTCDEKKVNFVLLDESKIDFSELPILTEDDGLYNCARGSELFECIMLNNRARTFYKKFPGTDVFRNSAQVSVLHRHNNISIPLTIYSGTNNRTLLEKYVNHLKGFPLILKIYGGSLGVGVMMANDWTTLYCITDHLTATKTPFALKQFIPSDSCERLVVLGNEVIAGDCKPNKDNDCRSDGTKAFHREYSKNVRDLAVAATNRVNLELAGVDIIIDKNTGIPYVLEVNFPFNFVPTQEISGVDIAGKMIDYLMRKKEY